jgi:diketogulonate reductase-like aldo/keto reductase
MIRTAAMPTASPLGSVKITLNDGLQIPAVGLGVFKSTPGQETYNATLTALRLGYRHVDTAALYRNEADVGRAIRDSGIPREEIWVTSKLWAMGCNGDGYQYGLQQAQESVKKLGTHMDLYLIHSPHNPQQRIGMWLALEELQRKGFARSIGVSNYGPHQLEELINDQRTTVVPSMNQIEVNPFLLRNDIEAYCVSKGIVIQAWAPLAKATKLNHPVVSKIGAGHGVSSAQVMVRWSLQRGYNPLPKSVKAARIATNGDVFGFELSSGEMQQLNALDEHMALGWQPMDGP